MMRTRFGQYLDGKGIRQDWLAHKCGINKDTLNRLVTGKTKAIHLVTAQKIVRVLNKEYQFEPPLTVDDLWPLEDDE